MAATTRPGARCLRAVGNVGRRTGQPRQTCVGNGLIENTCWLVAAHGQQADWVRNVQRDPHVRVLVNRRWRTGTAVPLPGDDPAQRSHTLPHRWDAALGRMIATTPLTVRIDLVPEQAARVGRYRQRAR
ncbi:MAG: nitroreductase/quinone reductase family protein [Jatrophihabitans sp.]